LFRIFDNVPVDSDWDQLRKDPVVLDISLEEFWDIYFSDDAQFATDTFLKEKDVNNHI
jgi:hypothetical protein